MNDSIRQTTSLSPQASARIPALEGLRGIAAFVVVVRHSFGVVKMDEGLRRAVTQGTFAPLLNADGAVALFFVLSGVVLAGSIERSRGRWRTLRFLVRRIFRIHPPYLAAVLLAWCASFFYSVPAGPGWSRWIRRLGDAHLEPTELLRSSLFPGMAFGQLPVGWTLEIEMLLSLVFPLLYLIAGRLHWIVLVVGGAVLLALDLRPLSLPYSFDFCLGIAIYRERERLAGWLERAPIWLTAAAALLSIFFWTLPEWAHWSVFHAGLLMGGPLLRERILSMGVGAAGLVILATHVGWFGRALCNRPTLFLARIIHEAASHARIPLFQE